VIDVLFSTSSNELICACADRSIGFWDLATGVADSRYYYTAGGRRHVLGQHETLSFGRRPETGLRSGLEWESRVHLRGQDRTIAAHGWAESRRLVKRTFQAGDLLCRQKTIIDMRTGRIVADLDELISSKKIRRLQHHP
jgi:hypothetical protein